MQEQGQQEQTSDERWVCDFCAEHLPSNHFYSTPTDERCICNWCFGDMVGVPYSPNKQSYQKES